MVHGENTAKMEFLTAIVKILLPRTSAHLLHGTTEKLVQRWHRRENAERIPGCHKEIRAITRCYSKFRALDSYA
jgi:hypothetical protein